MTNETIRFIEMEDGLKGRVDDASKRTIETLRSVYNLHFDTHEIIPTIVATFLDSLLHRDGDHLDVERVKEDDLDILRLSLLTPEFWERYEVCGEDAVCEDIVNFNLHSNHTDYIQSIIDLDKKRKEEHKQELKQRMQEELEALAANVTAHTTDEEIRSNIQIISANLLERETGFVTETSFSTMAMMKGFIGYRKYSFSITFVDHDSININFVKPIVKDTTTGYIE